MRRTLQSALVVILLVAGVGLLVVGCMGGGGVTTEPGAQTTLQPASTQSSNPTGSSIPDMLAEALSTFKSKDPFVQQALPPSTTGTTTTTTSSPGGGATSTTFRLTTTTFRLTTTTRQVTTSTTAHPTTTTTAAHKHMLKILSVGVVGGAPAVTLQVDNSVYKDKRVGDVMSTSWGQVKVLDLSTASKVATLLHGSETVVLTQGQQIFE